MEWSRAKSWNPGILDPIFSLSTWQTVLPRCDYPGAHRHSNNSRRAPKEWQKETARVTPISGGEKSITRPHVLPPIASQDPVCPSVCAWKREPIVPGRVSRESWCFLIATGIQFILFLFLRLQDRAQQHVLKLVTLAVSKGDTVLFH